MHDYVSCTLMQLNSLIRMDLNMLGHVSMYSGMGTGSYSWQALWPAVREDVFQIDKASLLVSLKEYAKWYEYTC